MSEIEANIVLIGSGVLFYLFVLMPYMVKAVLCYRYNKKYVNYHYDYEDLFFTGLFYNLALIVISYITYAVYIKLFL